jgi:hypothetical protein
MAIAKPARMSWTEPFELRSVNGHDWAGPVVLCRFLALLTVGGLTGVAFAVEPVDVYLRPFMVGLGVLLGALWAFMVPRIAALPGTQFGIDPGGIACRLGTPLWGWGVHEHYPWKKIASLRIVRATAEDRDFRVLIISGPNDTVLNRSGLRDNIQEWAEAKGVSFTDEVGDE